LMPLGIGIVRAASLAPDTAGSVIRAS
jgi:hypothetical protein